MSIRTKLRVVIKSRGMDKHQGMLGAWAIKDGKKGPNLLAKYQFWLISSAKHVVSEKYPPTKYEIEWDAR